MNFCKVTIRVKMSIFIVCGCNADVLMNAELQYSVLVCDVTEEDLSFCILVDTASWLAYHIADSPF